MTQNQEENMRGRKISRKYSLTFQLVKKHPLKGHCEKTQEGTKS